MNIGLSDIFLPYQRDWVLDEDRYKIWCKSRRIGATWAESAWSVRRRLAIKEDHFFVTTDEKTAHEFIRYCKKWAEAFNLMVGESLIDLTSKGTTNDTLVMPNGSRIVALSSAPGALRGKGGSVTLDEFAFHDQAEQLYGAAQAVPTMGRLSPYHFNREMALSTCSIA